jgi:hypothetical protein
VVRIDDHSTNPRIKRMPIKASLVLTWDIKVAIRPQARVIPGR